MHKKKEENNLTHSDRGTSVEHKLVENLIELQKIHTNLAEKLDKLSSQLSGLLALFEMSAKSFAKQPHLQTAEKDKEFLDKIDKLLDQNKTIAKGLTLMEEKMREKIYGSPAQPGQPESEPSIMSSSRPLPRF